MSKKPELDMLNGPLLPQILRFSLPLALTGVLQLLFNAADVIVVGKFAGSASLAAVGATSALISLLTSALSASRSALTFWSHATLAAVMTTVSTARCTVPSR